MSSKLNHSAGYKTYAVIVDGVQVIVTIRRLPLRAGDNNSRYRVRLTKAALDGTVIRTAHRDMDIIKAYGVYEQNVSRLASLAGE